jgi:hypothetical protein
MLMDHMLQICGYAMGATNKYGEVIHPGGIIKVRNYTNSRAKKIFFEYKISFEHCNVLMDGLREVVAMIRSGNVFPNPGHYCYFCEMLGPHMCAAELIQLTMKE